MFKPIYVIAFKGEEAFKNPENTNTTCYDAEKTLQNIAEYVEDDKPNPKQLQLHLETIFGKENVKLKKNIFIIAPDGPAAYFKKMKKKMEETLAAMDNTSESMIHERYKIKELMDNPYGTYFWPEEEMCANTEQDFAEDLWYMAKHLEKNNIIVFKLVKQFKYHS